MLLSVPVWSQNLSRWKAWIYIIPTGADHPQEKSLTNVRCSPKANILKQNAKIYLPSFLRGFLGCLQCRGKQRSLCLPRKGAVARVVLFPRFRTSLNSFGKSLLHSVPFLIKGPWTKPKKLNRKVSRRLKARRALAACFSILTWCKAALISPLRVWAVCRTSIVVAPFAKPLQSRSQAKTRKILS